VLQSLATFLNKRSEGRNATLPPWHLLRKEEEGEALGLSSLAVLHGLDAAGAEGGVLGVRADFDFPVPAAFALASLS
jgi:hypothetical protein